MKWIDYREKLGIGFNDPEKEKMFANKIANRLTSLFQTVYNNYYYQEYETIIEKYYTEIGEPVPYNANLFQIAKNISGERTLTGIISKYIALLNVVEQTLSRKEYNIFFSFLEKSLTELKISYEIIGDEDGVFVFTRGAKELDDALVSELLEWLSGYPKSRIAFINALKEYSSQTDENASDIADKFRKSLETFFQEFFNSGKSLENYKKEYGDYLKEKGVPAELRNIFPKLLESYTEYINNYAKHHDKTSKNVLEYIMYQTGSLMRLLITLKSEVISDAD